MIKKPHNDKENINFNESGLSKRRPIDVYSTEVNMSEVIRSSALGAVAVLADLLKPAVEKIHHSYGDSHEVSLNEAVELYMKAVQKVGKSRFEFRNDEFERKAQMAEMRLAGVVVRSWDS